jgi:hypothetical protein
LNDLHRLWAEAIPQEFLFQDAFTYRIGFDRHYPCAKPQENVSLGSVVCANIKDQVVSTQTTKKTAIEAKLAPDFLE